MAGRNDECQVFCGLVQTHSEDALFKRRMLRRSRCMRCWCWADSRWGDSQSEVDFMLWWFVCTCLRSGVCWIKSWIRLFGCGWFERNHFLGTWTRETRENVSVKKWFIFFGCEQILQDVIVFNVLAKVRSLSEIVFPQLFLFYRSIVRTFLSAIFQ